MLLNQTEKPFKKLGFHRMEAAEITTKLNVVLSTYQVFYHKAQTFHWNVKGGDFFDVHGITEELYKDLVIHIDAIAERIRLFGAIPNYRLSDYIRDSVVKEISHDRSAEYMIAELAEDLQKVIETLLDAHDYASKHGDIGSIHLIQKQTFELESYHWKLVSWTNKSYK